MHFITLIITIGNVAAWLWILSGILLDVQEKQEHELNEGKKISIGVQK